MANGSQPSDNTMSAATVDDSDKAMLSLFHGDSHVGGAARKNCDEITELLSWERSYLDERFPLVVITGCSVAVLGISANLFLLYIFTHGKRRTSSAHIFLGALALLDIIIQLNYVALIGCGVAKDYFNSVLLHRLWNSYVRPLYAISTICQIAQTYIIVTITIERFLVVYGAIFWSRRHRWLAITTVLAFAAVYKLSTFWEVDVQYNNCSGFAAVHTEPSGLMENQLYTKYKFYGDPIFNVYLPFTVLFLLNVLVILRLWQGAVDAGGGENSTPSTNNTIPLLITNQHHRSPMKHDQPTSASAQLMHKRRSSTRHGRGLKDATLTMVVIVTCYLIANALNLIVKFFEQTDQSFLEIHAPKFYFFASDCSSFLVLITCSIRLPLYYLCNRNIRQEIKLVFLQKIAKSCCPATLSKQWATSQLSTEELSVRSPYPTDFEPPLLDLNSTAFKQTPIILRNGNAASAHHHQTSANLNSPSDSYLIVFDDDKWKPSPHLMLANSRDANQDIQGEI